MTLIIDKKQEHFISYYQVVNVLFKEKDEKRVHLTHIMVYDHLVCGTNGSALVYFTIPSAIQAPKTGLYKPLSINKSQIILKKNPEVSTHDYPDAFAIIDRTEHKYTDSICFDNVKLNSHYFVSELLYVLGSKYQTRINPEYVYRYLSIYPAKCTFILSLFMHKENPAENAVFISGQNSTLLLMPLEIK